ncbi:MAG: type IX secretion system outer membrane channel protein PorV, partial [Chitinophagales bacterium]|nr:type IX secretion system outer membrane channel protein PorV [Chitinophagales bacterium]
MKRINQLRTASLFIVFAALLYSAGAQAQTIADSLDGRVNVINTAVPFLRIAPDARSGAMGDVGVALSPDANSVFWNTAKITFAQQKMSLGVTYTPWLRSLVNDIYLASLGGYYKVDEKQALAFGLRYFSLGSITFTSASGQIIGDFSPQEFAIDVGYSRKIAEHFSIGLNLGFVYSNLAASYVVNNVPIKAGKAVKADISTFYTHPAKFGKTKGSYSIGATIANIGNKISYTESAENKDFLPCNLGIGGDVSFQFDEYNKLSFDLDFNKLLVPTPDSSGDYRDLTTVQGIFNSFTDAPGGFSEEMREIMISTGAEYWYRELFSVRAGFFYEDPTKGDRQFITAGFGIKYNVFGLNFSYLIPTSSQKTPLDNTLRFSLLFDFAAMDKAPEEA